MEEGKETPSKIRVTLKPLIFSAIIIVLITFLASTMVAILNRTSESIGDQVYLDVTGVRQDFEQESYVQGPTDTGHEFRLYFSDFTVWVNVTNFWVQELYDINVTMHLKLCDEILGTGYRFIPKLEVNETLEERLRISFGGREPVKAIQGGKLNENTTGIVSLYHNYSLISQVVVRFRSEDNGTTACVRETNNMNRGLGS